jgi:hypothetical protein
MATGGLNLIPVKVTRKNLTIEIVDLIEEIKRQLIESGELDASTVVEVRSVIGGKSRALGELSGGDVIRLTWEI